MAEGFPPVDAEPNKPATRAPRKPAAVGSDAIEPLATSVAPVNTDMASDADKPSGLKAKASEAARAVKDEALSLRGQAADKAREAARGGKDKATDALDNVAKLIEDAAGTVDDKVGAQFGDYTRQAAQAIGGFASTLKQKDVDELVEDATAFVRKSPAIALGAAAAVGFVLARLIKAGAAPDTRA